MKAKGSELLDIVALGIGVALYFEPVDFQIWLSKAYAYAIARQIEKEEKKND